MKPPTIVMQGWDIAQPYVLKPDPVRVDITAPNGGIQSLLVDPESSRWKQILPKCRLWRVNSTSA